MSSKIDLSDNLDHWNYLDRYSLWMFHIFEAYIGKSVFEVGAGMGRMVDFYVHIPNRIVATDIFQHQVDYMNERYRDVPSFEAERVNILEDDLTMYEGNFDTVICINVLEHLSDDYTAVKRMKSLLDKSGKLILMVPAWQKLYCKMDENVGHFRRYDPGRLNDIAKRCGLNTVKHHYFNMFGIIPYWFKGKSGYGANNKESFSTSLNENNSRIYNIASVILEPFERLVLPPIGLTEVIILKK